LSWDNAQSVTDKVNYAKSNGLGGWMIWVLGWDDLPGQTPEYPLLAAVKAAFNPSTSLSPCDVNGDGSTNIQDVQLETNMALKTIACTNPSGTCTVTSVQRVVNAVLGGSCVTP